MYNKIIGSILLLYIVFIVNNCLLKRISNDLDLIFKMVSEKNLYLIKNNFIPDNKLFSNNKEFSNEDILDSVEKIKIKFEELKIFIFILIMGFLFVHIYNNVIEYYQKKYNKTKPKQYYNTIFESNINFEPNSDLNFDLEPEINLYKNLFYHFRNNIDTSNYDEYIFNRNLREQNKIKAFKKFKIQ